MLTLRTNAAGYFTLDLRDTIGGSDLSGQTVLWQTYDSDSVAVSGHNGTASYVGTVTISGNTCYRFRVAYTQSQAALLTPETPYRVNANCAAIGMGWDAEIKATRYAGA